MIRCMKTDRGDSLISYNKKGDKEKIYESKKFHKT